MGATVQEPQRMPETTYDTKPYMFCFSYAYMPMIQFNL